jgi:hypothetical protein
MGFETTFANKSMLSNKVKLVYSLFRPTVLLPTVTALLYGEAKVPFTAIVAGSGMCLPHLRFQLV